SDDTVIGLNVSGLLYFQCRDIGLETDYVELTRRLIDWALAKPNVKLMLIPHVIRNEDKPRWWRREQYVGDADDRAACRAAFEAWGGAKSDRICWLKGAHDAARVKYGIGRCDFFIGARMHSFIGATSQMIPGALLAYSKKAAGLSQLVGIGEAVVDLRTQSAEACVDAVDRLFESRQALRSKLQQRIPEIKSEVSDFFSEELAPLIYRCAGIDAPARTVESAASHSP
ncbi:MAG: polysaccharide pyruvyl transferase family protein, partial [Planctomycetales bacterium]|nr:polysaccharide pyruvyl transferase family protein [Planctomycetales bacterium]